MTKIIILVALIVLIYLYWKSQHQPKQLSQSSETIYETEFPDLELKEFSEKRTN